LADLEHGRRERLVPDFPMQHYDISADGRRVVFVAAGETESSPIWVAALDGSAPPRRLVDKDGLAAFFGANGDVLFAAREGATHFLYRVKEDGTDLTKLTQVFNIFAISPDGRWVSAQQPPNSGTSSSLVSTIGEPSVLLSKRATSPARSKRWGGRRRSAARETGNSRTSSSIDRPIRFR
jgi:Tol biopolymer transport system component